MTRDRLRAKRDEDAHHDRHDTNPESSLVCAHLTPHRLMGGYWHQHRLTTGPQSVVRAAQLLLLNRARQRNVIATLTAAGVRRHTTAETTVQVRDGHGLPETTQTRFGSDGPGSIASTIRPSHGVHGAIVQV